MQKKLRQFMHILVKILHRSKSL